MWPGLVEVAAHCRQRDADHRRADQGDRRPGTVAGRTQRPGPLAYLRAPGWLEVTSECGQGDPGVTNCGRMRPVRAQRPGAAAGGSRDGRIKISESLVLVRCRSESSLTQSPGKGQPVNLARAVRLTKPRLVVRYHRRPCGCHRAGLLRPSRPLPAPMARAGLHWNGGTKPVIVLVHGAWADASSWDGGIQRLQNNGYTVYAPPNPRCAACPASPSSDPAYLHDFLTQNAALAGKPIVLVGHSYGGAVITNAAVSNPEVKALVYVDTSSPASGGHGFLRLRARIVPAQATPPISSTWCPTLAARPGTSTPPGAGPSSPAASPAACPQAGRRHSCHPAAAGSQHAVRASGTPAGRPPALGRDRHRRQGHSAALLHPWRSAPRLTSPR